MKRLVFLVIALLAIVSLAGCGGGGGSDNNTNNNGTGNNDGNNNTGNEYWAAYQFGDTVKPVSGGSGTIDTFTIESNYTEGGKARQFKMEGTYLGKETAQIVTQKMVMTTSPYGVTYENVTTPLECYKIKHKVTVILDETGDEHPAWAEITVWIPTGKLESSAQYAIYPKSSYQDADGQTGEWSYYLTAAMQSEMQSPPAGKTVTYMPAGDGEFYGYNDYAFFGLYGWGWFWFGAFAEGGTQHLATGSWSLGGYNYSVTKGDKTVGGYKFSAWIIDWSVSTVAGSAAYQGVISDDLPVPIHLKIGSSGGGSSGSWEYTLTDLKLK